MEQCAQMLPMISSDHEKLKHLKYLIIKEYRSYCQYLEMKPSLAFADIIWIKNLTDVSSDIRFAAGILD